MNYKILIITIPALLIISGSCMIARAELPSWDGHCSIYSKSGDAWMVTIDPTLAKITMITSAGLVRRFSTFSHVVINKDKYAKYTIGCLAFFDASGKYLAIAFNAYSPDYYAGSDGETFDANSLRMIIFDVRTMKIIDIFTVNPSWLVKGSIDLGWIFNGRASAGYIRRWAR